MAQDADGLQDMSNDLDLSREIRWVTKDLLCLCREFHRLSVSTLVVHGSLDSNSFVAIVFNLINAGVEHVRSAINSREACESLRELPKAVQRIDIRRLSIARDRVTI
jgi:hypothetical protein